MDKLATDPVIWQKLRKKFKKLDGKEKTAPAGQWLRLHDSPAPDSSPDDPRVVYQLDRGRDEDFSLEFTELAQEAGKALGFTCTLNVAFNAWVARVFADAYRDKSKWLRYMDAVYSPVDLLNEREREWAVERLWEVAVMTEAEQAKLHEALRMKGVGELTRLGLLSAKSCRYLEWEAKAAQTLPPSPPPDEESKPEEKPNKKPGKGRPANPVVEWRREIIRKVSATGVKGEAYCVALGGVRISISKTGLETPVPWQKEKPPCPKSYVNPWNDPDPKQRTKWRQRVANEKSKATRQNPH